MWFFVHQAIFWFLSFLLPSPLFLAVVIQATNLYKSPSVGLRSGWTCQGFQGASLLHNSPSVVCSNSVFLTSFLSWMEQLQGRQPITWRPSSPVLLGTQSRCCQSSVPSELSHLVTPWASGELQKLLQKRVQTRINGSPSNAVVWPFPLTVIGKCGTLLYTKILPC